MNSGHWTEKNKDRHELASGTAGSAAVGCHPIIKKMEQKDGPQTGGCAAQVLFSVLHTEGNNSIESSAKTSLPQLR